MTNSETNFVKIIKEICSEEGILLRSYSSDWIFMLEKDGKRGIIMGYQFGLNSASVNMLCCDKCAASDLMTEFGIPNIGHVLFASPENQKFIGYPGFWRDLLALLDQHGTIVCKPNEGTGGENVFKCSTDCELEAAVHRIFAKSDYLAVSKYYEIEDEYRAVILDGEIRLLYRKRRPQVIGDGIHTVSELILAEGAAFGMDSGHISKAELARSPAKGERVLLNWRHNLGQGARADILTESFSREKPVCPDEGGQARRRSTSGKSAISDRIADIARRVYEEIGVRFASVDIVDTEDGLKVLELNSGVMMENFAGQDESSYQTAKEIYRDAIRLMMK